MNEGTYNPELCKERHTKVDWRQAQFEKRLDKLEDRFLAMLTTLIMNLVGVLFLIGVQILHWLR